MRDGVLGGGDRIAEGRVHHDDAAARSRPGCRHCRRRCRRGRSPSASSAAAMHLVGDLGGRADGEAVIVADDFEQLVLVLAEIGQVVDLDAAVLEDLRRRRAKACRRSRTRGMALMLLASNVRWASRRAAGDGPCMSSGSRLASSAFCVGEGPVEPGHQRLEVGGLDGRAAPDAQARRRVAIGADVVGDAFLLEQRDDALGERRLRRPSSAATTGSTIDRHTEVLERVAGSAARIIDPRRPSRPSRASTLALASARGDQRLRARRSTSPSRARRDSPRRTASTAC